jgi:hypothetical protein
MNENQTKVCPRCKLELSSSEFYKNKQNKDGLYYICKECDDKRIANLKEKPFVREVFPEGYKRCKECKEILSLESFSKDNQKPRGTIAICRNCRSNKRNNRTEYNLVEYKTCYRCKIEKHRSEFSPSQQDHTGITWSCKSCNSKYGVEKRKKNPELVRQRYRDYYHNRNDRERWASTSITGHKKSGYTILFSSKELAAFAKTIDNCPICGKLLCWTNNMIKPDSPSLENLDTKDAMSISDITILCIECNTRKGRCTLENYIKYMEDSLPKLREMHKIRQKALLSSESATLDAQDSHESEQVPSHRLDT